MKIVTVVALAMVVLVSRTAFANSDGKIPLSTSLVVVRVILPSVQRNPMTFAAPGPAIAAPDGLITFLMDIASGVTYHPDFGAFSDYVHSAHHGNLSVLASNRTFPRASPFVQQ
jgi:hypothetical protein